MERMIMDIGQEIDEIKQIRGLLCTVSSLFVFSRIKLRDYASLFEKVLHQPKKSCPGNIPGNPTHLSGKPPVWDPYLRKNTEERRSRGGLRFRCSKSARNSNPADRLPSRLPAEQIRSKNIEILTKTS